jgi:ribosome biogenesis GTPase
MSKKRKIRADFRKNREVRTRQNDLTGQCDDAHDDDLRGERVRAKGSISRKRTLAGGEITEDDSGTVVLPEIDPEKCRLGRVLRVQGLVSLVEDDAGRVFQCATRRLLKSISTDQRHVVAAGDRVWFRVEERSWERSEIRDQSSESDSSDLRPPTSDLSEGIIERVEPRRGVLSRTSRGRQHVIVANVDQLIIVGSAAEPRLKPNLIDRLLVTAERARIRPVICINKIDLVEPADLLPLVGVYGQLGYQVLLTSAETAQGIDQLRHAMYRKQSVVTGQSGVGKSSLLNAIQPGLDRIVKAVSRDTQKGRHTTTTAELIRLETGGWSPEERTGLYPPASGLQPPASYVVDTPGIRQFELWDVIPEEVAGYFRDIRPYVSQCRFPDCTHTHEDECAVKDAVADGWIDTRRYESYMQICSE